MNQTLLPVQYSTVQYSKIYSTVIQYNIQYSEQFRNVETLFKLIVKVPVVVQFKYSSVSNLET